MLPLLLPPTRATAVQSPRTDQHLGDARAGATSSPGRRGLQGEWPPLWELTPSGDGSSGHGTAGRGNRCAGPRAHPASLHSLAGTRPSALRTTPGHHAQLCACAAPSTLFLRGGGRAGSGDGGAGLDPCSAGWPPRAPRASKAEVPDSRSLRFSGFLPEVRTVIRGVRSDSAVRHVCVQHACVCMCAVFGNLHSGTGLMSLCPRVQCGRRQGPFSGALRFLRLLASCPQARGTAVSTVRAAPGPLSCPLLLCFLRSCLRGHLSVISHLEGTILMHQKNQLCRAPLSG